MNGTGNGDDNAAKGSVVVSRLSDAEKELEKITPQPNMYEREQVTSDRE